MKSEPKLDIVPNNWGLDFGRKIGNLIGILESSRLPDNFFNMPVQALRNLKEDAHKSTHATETEFRADKSCGLVPVLEGIFIHLQTYTSPEYNEARLRDAEETYAKFTNEVLRNFDLSDEELLAISAYIRPADRQKMQ